MKRKELKPFVQAIKNLREGATDEQALESVYAFAEWKADMEYSVCDRIREEDKLYRCVQAHTSQAGWNPSSTPALWARISIEDWPEWVQPYGSEDAYHQGDKVSHINKHWVSTTDGNVWEPGVYGWTEV